MPNHRTRIDRRALPALALLLGLSAAGCSSGEAAAESGSVEEAGAVPSQMDAATDAGTQEVAKWGADLLNPNLAEESEIAALPGITPGAVSAIMGGRPFLDMVALDAAIATQMDETARETLYGAMWIPSNLNAASEAELLLIPGVGDRMAYEFDEYRPYDGLERFRREIGKYVDDDVVEGYLRYFFLPIDLNTASDEQILMIPGVGSRMLREFKEYRPYDGLERFRREIGKYVDDGEVARLERYVMIAGD